MLNDMLQYNIAIMQAITTFLSNPPIIYILSFILLLVIVRIYLMIIRPGKG